MDKIDIIESTAVLVPVDNIDTDQIIPARFLKTTSREGFGEKLFYDWRYDADGTPSRENPLAGQKGVILVAGNNFGCGSSREHAAWALAGYGFKAVVSSSFADIHRQNELNSFVLPVEVSREFLSELFGCIRENPGTVLRIDVGKRTVTNTAAGRSEEFPLDAYKRYCLMNGLDDIDFLLERRDLIEEFERRWNSR